MSGLECKGEGRSQVKGCGRQQRHIGFDKWSHHPKPVLKKWLDRPFWRSEKKSQHSAGHEMGFPTLPGPFICAAGRQGKQVMLFEGVQIADTKPAIE